MSIEAVVNLATELLVSTVHYFRRIWIVIVTYGVLGLGVAMGSIPIYADMLNIAK